MKQGCPVSMGSKWLVLAAICAVACLAGCRGGDDVSGREFETAEAFLVLYYTVEEYQQPPRTEQEVAAQEENWQPYLTADALDVFMLNREATCVSGAAEQAGVKISVTDVAFEPIHEEFGYFKYAVEAEMAGPSDVKEIVFTGKIGMDEQEGLVNYFHPDAAPLDVIEGAAEQ